MIKIFFILALLVFIGIPQQGLAKLSAPFDAVVDRVGERSVKVKWSWIPGGDGTISKFIIDGGLKRDSDGKLVGNCNAIGDWFQIHEEPGQKDRTKNLRGLERGQTYCWRVMAQALDTDDNSIVELGEEFITEIGNRVSCPPDCGPGSGSGIPDVLGNPISSKTLPQLLENVLNFLFGLSIVILPIIILYGGILLLTAGGNPEKISQSRTILLWAVIAFAIILLARGLPTVLRNLL